MVETNGHILVEAETAPGTRTSFACKARSTFRLPSLLSATSQSTLKTKTQGAELVIPGGKRKERIEVALLISLSITEVPRHQVDLKFNIVSYHHQPS